MEQEENKKIPPLTPLQRNAKKALLANFRIQIAETEIQVKGLEEAISLDLPEKKAKAQLLGLKSDLETLKHNEEATLLQLKNRS